MPGDAAVDGIGDEAEAIAVHDVGADELVDRIMDVYNDNIFVEEFMKDLPIQDDLKEENSIEPRKIR